MKTHTTVSVDYDKLETVKNMRINLSGAVNDLLAEIIERETGDKTGINIIIEEKNKEKAHKEIIKWTAAFKLAEQNIKIWKEKKEKTELNTLEKKRDKLEASKSCVICGTKYGEGYERWKKFPAGKICFGCYMSKREVKRWFKDADDPGSEVQ